jgi:hypothetical protein
MKKMKRRDFLVILGVAAAATAAAATGLELLETSSRKTETSTQSTTSIATTSQTTASTLVPGNPNGFGSRIFRIRYGSQMENGDSVDLDTALAILGQLPGMDNANRFTDGVPSSSQYSDWIDAINGIMTGGSTNYNGATYNAPQMRTYGADYCVSTRMDWSNYSGNTTKFLSDAQTIWDNVYSLTSPPQRGISIDNASYIGQFDLSQDDMNTISSGLFAMGWKYIAWGASANPYANSTGVTDANFAMLITDSSSLQIQTGAEVDDAVWGSNSAQGIIQQLIDWKYLSISSHIDEPGDFSQWLANCAAGMFASGQDTLANEEAALTTIFTNPPVPATFQLIQGELYNALTGTAVSKNGVSYPYPTLDFFSNLL